MNIHFIFIIHINNLGNKTDDIIIELRFIHALYKIKLLFLELFKFNVSYSEPKSSVLNKPQSVSYQVITNELVATYID